MTRVAVTMFGFLAGASAIGAVVLRLLSVSDIPRPQVTLDAVHVIRSQFESQKTLPKLDATVVLLGDSLLMGVQPGGSTWVAGVTRDVLTAASSQLESRISTKSVVYTGLSLYSHYFLIDEILAMEPTLVVIEFNLYYFSRFWEGRERVHLASFLPVSRWPSLLALRPERIGLTLDEVVLFRALFAAGWLDEWRWFQLETARIAKGYWRTAELLQAGSGFGDGLSFRARHRLRYLGERNLPFRERSTPFYARELYGAALDGDVESHTALGVLSALVAEFRAAGVATLVYVPPYNVEHLRELGVWNETAINRTIGSVKATAEMSGARFADFHAILPDSAFRDAMDHLTEGDEQSGIHVLSERLSAEILAVMPNPQGR